MYCVTKYVLSCYRRWYMYLPALNGVRSVRRIYVCADDRQICRSIEATCYTRAKVSLCALQYLPIEVRHTYR